MALSIFPDLRVNYGETLFASVPDGIGWNAANRDGWRAGPLAKIRFGRNERNGGSPFLIAGAATRWRAWAISRRRARSAALSRKSFGPRRAWRTRAEVRQGFGGHDGVVADLSAAYRARIGRAIVSAGPRMTLASAPFMRTYFGISPAQSTRTGLAPYRAAGSVLSYGLGGNVIRPLNRRSAPHPLHQSGAAGRPAADSPLIRERGQRMQATLGWVRGPLRALSRDGGRRGADRAEPEDAVIIRIGLLSRQAAQGDERRAIQIGILAQRMRRAFHVRIGVRRMGLGHHPRLQLTGP